MNGLKFSRRLTLHLGHLVLKMQTLPSTTDPLSLAVQVNLKKNIPKNLKQILKLRYQLHGDLNNHQGHLLVGMAALLGNGGDSELVVQVSNFTYIFTWQLDICSYILFQLLGIVQFHCFQALLFPFGAISTDFSRRRLCSGICNSDILHAY